MSSTCKSSESYYSYHALILYDPQSRLEHTPDQKAEAPEKSVQKKEAKIQSETGKLERKILMREVLYKALEIKRKEIADATKKNESEGSSSTVSTITTPQKLTFYDVVQLARQQALAKKTQVPGEDISVEFTETNVLPDLNVEGCTANVQDGENETHESSCKDTLATSPLSSPELDPITSKEHTIMDLLDFADPLSSPEPPTSNLPAASDPHISSNYTDLGLSEVIKSQIPQELASSSLVGLIDPHVSPIPASLGLLGLVSPQVPNESASSSLVGLVDPHVSPRAVNEGPLGLIDPNTPAKPTKFGTAGGVESQESPEKKSDTDLINFMDDQAFQEPSGLNIVGLSQSETTRKPSVVDLLGFDDSEAVQHFSVGHISSYFDPRATQEDLAHRDASNLLPDDSSTVTARQEISPANAPVAQESVHLESMIAKESKPTPMDSNLQLHTSFDQSESSYQQNLQRHDTSETLSDSQSITTATPSIFSQSSTLNSAASSVPSFTAGELQALRSSAGSLQSPRLTSEISPLFKEKTMGLTRPSLSQSIIQEDEGETLKSSSATEIPTAGKFLQSHPQPQRSMSEDSVPQSLQEPDLPNVNEPDSQGCPLIVSAAGAGNEELVQRLLANDADIDASHATTGRDALSEASLHGHLKVVDVLIQEKCPLDHLDAEGFTALHHACATGHLSIAKSLLANDAPIETLGPHGETALHLAMRTPYPNVVMLLVQSKKDLLQRSRFRWPDSSTHLRKPRQFKHVQLSLERRCTPRRQRRAVKDSTSASL